MPSPHPSAEATRWFKSSYSGGNTTECVEVAWLPAYTAVRDSKCTAGPRLSFTAGAWSSFVAAVSAKRFERLPLIDPPPRQPS
ncbi:DUF397 domain-containing protein [Streptomyces sp. TRM64462]|uniref:DUF397 domain-containing protein n=1 Tax=Streptomyces sp. TRM64462 TaxID=2741726 RepID=UPI001586F666|nr:DUF397 domain-containing protein [Streptomyces sp. TRM64462]